VLVAFLVAWTAGVFTARITSTGIATISLASAFLSERGKTLTVAFRSPQFKRDIVAGEIAEIAKPFLESLKQSRRQRFR
jgi:hypothetical protein